MTKKNKSTKATTSKGTVYSPAIETSAVEASAAVFAASIAAVITNAVRNHVLAATMAADVSKRVDRPAVTLPVGGAALSGSSSKPKSAKKAKKAAKKSDKKAAKSADTLKAMSAEREALEAKILGYLESHPNTRVEELVKELSANRDDVRYVVARLFALGKVRRRGNTRATKYSLPA